MSVLRGPSSLPFNAIPFDKVNPSDFLPELKEAVANANQRLAEYKKGTGITFKEVFGELDQVEEEVNYITSIFYTLFYAHSTDELQAISEEFSSIITAFESELSLDEDVFRRVKSCYEDRANQNLTAEELTIVELGYKSFVRNGALLNDEDKDKLKKIDQELSKLSVEFNQNTLKATNKYKLFVDDESKLKGIPESALSQAKELAKKEGKENAWCFTLQYPSMLPVLKYCEDREIRRELHSQSNVKATNGEFDNRENVKKQVRLRHERANLLGYESHGAYVLEWKMASTPDTVMNFLEDLYTKSLPFAKQDVDKLKELAKADGIEEFAGWDTAFYTEKLKKKELDFDDEELKPYFKLDNSLNGMFEVAKKLYDISFNKKDNYPVYHEEVQVYEVHDDKLDESIGLFYVDLHPRETKSSGAWMMGIRKHGFQFGEVKKPIVSITCNFTAPTKDKPALLTLNELTTLYHEFGHALHGLLSKCEYTSYSGTSVLHDFVELPSQIMENWVMEKECLDLFAFHYETGEKMPQVLVDKIKKSMTFMEGYGTMRQLSFGFLDMAWHGKKIEDIENIDVKEYENKAMSKAMLVKRPDEAIMSCSFGHLFAGGYSAGYYGYKWAEVLDADAFEEFKENGIFNKEIASKFRENILAKGGSEHPMTLYKRFRGKEPSPDALLKRAGFLS